MARRDDYTLLLERHKPIKNHLDDSAYDGFLFETYGAEYEYIKSLPPERVFTILGEDKLYACPGKHWINRMGYFVVAIPWTQKQEGRSYFVG
jgi:hypothetical protein